MTTPDDLALIKQLCILNFLELQDIRRRLNIATGDTQGFYDYANAAHGYMKELNDKMRSLLKDFPHLA